MRIGETLDKQQLWINDHSYLTTRNLWSKQKRVVKASSGYSKFGTHAVKLEIRNFLNIDMEKKYENLISISLFTPSQSKILPTVTFHYLL